MAFVGLNSADTEALQDFYFPESPVSSESGIPENDNCSSFDSDSDSEITVQCSDVLHPGINAHELALDFCENNDIVIDSQDGYQQCPVVVDDEILIGDPDIIIISDKTKRGCGCSKNCLSFFTENEIYQQRLSMRELEKSEKESLLLGILCHSEVKSVRRCKVEGERQRLKFTYSFDQRSICEAAFLLLYDIGNKAFKNLKKHYKDNGVEPRIHGHKGRRAPNTFSFRIIENVVMFLKNHADENGLPMPAAPRGRNEIPPVYLPAYETKASIHKQYVTSCAESSHVGLTLFKNIWQHTLPHIQIMKPRSDLCFKCQKHRENISNAHTEDEKLAATAAFTEHIQQARKEREYYNNWPKSKYLLTIFNPVSNNQTV